MRQTAQNQVDSVLFFCAKAEKEVDKYSENGAWQIGKAYEGYYPQFIREQDYSVAAWLFDDFFDG